MYAEIDRALELPPIETTEAYGKESVVRGPLNRVDHIRAVARTADGDEDIPF